MTSKYYVAGIPFSATNSLNHHGIKGQRWGKRNGPPYPLDEEGHSKTEVKAGWEQSLEKSKNDTKKQKQRFQLTDRQKDIIKKVVIASAIVGVSAAYIYLDKKDKFIGSYIDNSNLKRTVESIGIDNLDDEDLFFEAGSEFHRMSSRAVEDYSNSDKIYAAFKPEDVQRYKTLMPDFFKEWRKNGVDIDPSKMYDIALKAQVDIKSPSAKKRVQAFVDLFQDSSFRAKIAKLYEKSPQEFDSIVRDNGGNKKFALGLYEEFAMALNADAEYADAPRMYFDKIRSMGYNAIVDDNDAGKLSETPMILLDPKNNYVVEGERQVKKLERFMAVMKVKGVDLDKAGTR